MKLCVFSEIATENIPTELIVYLNTMANAPTMPSKISEPVSA